MRVFYCRNRKEYQPSASGTFYGDLKCPAKIVNGKVRTEIEDMDTYVYGLKPHSHADIFKCYRCDKEEVVIVEVDACPHSWYVSGDTRKCHLCKTEQKGIVVFK